MADCLTQAEIDGFSGGSLSDPERARVQAHLADCSTCQQKVQPLTAHVKPEQGDDDETKTATPLGGASPSSRRASSASPFTDAIEGYDILGEIHRGGQGIVYKATQRSTHRTVAVKVLAEGRFASLRHRHRFAREIKLAAGLQHPNIVTIYDSGLAHGRYFYAMEYVHGRSIDAYVSRHKPGVEETLALFAKICDAVGYAHRNGVIHRDLKPNNILIDGDGQPHVLDFGMAKAAGSNVLADGTPVTETSDFAGTLAYASPEQVKGDPSLIDVRTDVYSLGVILHRMLTGVHPYSVRGELAEALKNIAEAEPPKPSSLRADVGRDVDTIVARALAKDRKRRYPTAEHLGKDVERVIKGEAIEARRDSLPYLVGLRTQALVQKHRMASHVVAALVAVLTAQVLAVPLIFRLTPVNRVFEHYVTDVLAPAVSGESFEHVRVVAITDDTEVDAIAQQEGLAEVKSGNWKSIRRLHGRLMEKLADSGVRGVAWDIAFAGETQFDSDFVQGVRELKKRGADVTVGVRAWWLHEQRLPRMSKVILPEVKWGGMTADLGAQGPWKLDLIVQRGSTDPLPSLALTAVTSAQQPSAEAAFVLNPPSGIFESDSEIVEVRYWESDPELPRVKRRIGQTYRIELSAVRSQEVAAPHLGLQSGDTIAHFFLDVPNGEVLAASTVEYTAVFSADEARLRGWFDGKVIVVGDLRSGIDRHPHPDGRTLPGCYAHAVGMDALLRATSIRMPRSMESYALTGMAAIIGLSVGVLAAPVALRRWMALAALTVATCLASVWAYRDFQFLCNPVIPVISLLVAGEAAALIQRLQRAHR